MGYILYMKPIRSLISLYFHNGRLIQMIHIINKAFHEALMHSFTHLFIHTG